MSRVQQRTLQELSHLQHQASQIRNVCILAHVDHGKTTLADCLVASNGIISRRNAGKIRYMDSRPDEQERGITVKSSAITLVYDDETDKSNVRHYLVNLIDSPGHVDFSSEVTTAVRLCDGAVVVVDVVEGVCPQTQAVLRQAWLENIQPVLVLNKVDRLITELKLSPTEAYYHLIQVLEQVNLVTSQLFMSEAMEQTSKDVSETSPEKTSEQGEINVYDWTVIEDEENHRNIFFSPETGNVVFASAYDGWAFRIQDFAGMYAAKLGMKEDVLIKTLWGDYFINIKSKRILKGAQSKGKKPLFVQFALENIWASYEAIVQQKDPVMSEKIIKSLGLSISSRESRHKDPRVLLQAVMAQWLPLAQAVLAMVVSYVPSPLAISPKRVEALMCSHNRQFASLPSESQALKEDFLACAAGDDVPVIIFVSKMFPVDKICLSQNKTRPLTAEELAKRREAVRQRHAEMLERKETQSSSPSDQTPETTQPEANGEGMPDGPVFIAFARVFSGTVRKGQTVYFLGPKHDPTTALTEVSSCPDRVPSHVTAVEIKDLYLLMGRELEAVDEVPAGNVLGLGGLEAVVLKSGTLSSTVACPAFTDLYFEGAAIVRVAVESVHAADMDRLVTGLHLLNQADPCVEVRVQETGEHVIIAAGEVHLQKCIDDLRERFACVELNVSKPIVPFRETLINPPKTDMVNENIEGETTACSLQVSTADGHCQLCLRAAPLPGRIPELLLQHQQALKALDSLTSQNCQSLKESMLEVLTSLRQQLQAQFDQAGGQWVGAVDKIWSFGPRHCGPNVLLNCVPGYHRPSLWGPILQQGAEGRVADFDNSIVSGFQMATLAGPLCEEPLHGVCFFVEDWWYGDKGTTAADHQGLVQKHSAVFGPLSGQLISTMKEGCRRTFQAQPQRLMAAMYKCEVQASTDVLGKLHAVLARRCGHVLSEEMQEGTDIFNIEATLPVVESFGFAEDIRKKTSGLASPQLKFLHWEVLSVDPFWVPTTEEEYLHFGEKADAENKARQYMNKVRKRKGLKTDEKIVEFAEKQRTLTKMK